MDSYHHHNPQNWYPTSAPQPPPPPPPPAGDPSSSAGGGYPHHQLPSGYPPVPQHHHWPPPDPHHQFPPRPPPQYPPPPRYPGPPPPQHQYAGPPLPPPQPHHQMPMRPPPGQTWGNPSWSQHQYPERIFPYNNEEDWAARARAWAATKSGTENHHMQSHFPPAYHDQYQQTVDARSGIQQLPLSQSSYIDPQGQTNSLHAGDEVIATNKYPVASPQKAYVPNSSIYEQEVPYSYSSASAGNREGVSQSGDSHAPSFPLPSIQEVPHTFPSMPVQMSSVDQLHFSHHGQSADFVPHVSDRPLNFEPRPSPDNESRDKVSYGHSGPTRVMGVMDHDLHATSNSSWTSTPAMGVSYPQIPSGPAGTQFDPSFTPQSSFPVNPAAGFGRMPAPSFQSSIPPVTAPFGLGNGSSLHHPTNFMGDANGLNLSERPKKAAVPNWLKEEIIKKKVAVPSIIQTQPSGNTLGHNEPEDDDKSIIRTDQADNKSIDSTKSTEDEDDDEEDVEVARSAAINQEIKRVLTEVLLKVTDELFDEIATKVINEDKLIVEAEVGDGDVPGKQNMTYSAAISTPMASAKILVPVKMDDEKPDGVPESSSISLPGKDLLGLGNYASDASDDDDDDEIRSANLLSSGKEVGSSLQLENNEKRDKRAVSVNNLKHDENASEVVSAVCEPVLAERRMVNELPSVNGKAHQSINTSKGKDNRAENSSSGHGNHDKSVNKDNRDVEAKSKLRSDRNSFGMEVKDSTHKMRHENSNANDSATREDKTKLQERSKKGEVSKESTSDRKSERGSNVKDSDSRRSSKDTTTKDERKDVAKDKKDKYKEDGERKRGREREEVRSTRPSKSSSKDSSRRSPSPKSRGKNSKGSSFSHGSASGDEPSDNSRKRKQQSVNSSLSPSPTKSRRRQVSRSPPSKQSHRRHSPYPTSERRRRRSRSISPVHRRR